MELRPLIVLDTHAWIWLASQPAQLSGAAEQEIATSGRIGVAAISCWEVAMLVEKGRISFDRAPLQWIEDALSIERLELLPLTPAVASRSTQLGADFHGDPADRMIVATALIERAALVSKDGLLQDFAPLKTIW